MLMESWGQILKCTFLELRSKTAMQHSQTSEEKNPKLASHSLSKIQRSLFFNTLF